MKASRGVSIFITIFDLSSNKKCSRSTHLTDTLNNITKRDSSTVFHSFFSSSPFFLTNLTYKKKNQLIYDISVCVHFFFLFLNNKS